MKTIVSNELKKRLEYASKNGSVIAHDILGELKKDIKDCFGEKTVNYFDSLRVVGYNSEYKSLKIMITACTKDVNNEHFPDKGNPRAPYFKENRERMAPGTFVGLFRNLRSYDTDEMNFFESALCVNDVVRFRLYNRMEDFERAYIGSNYYPFGASTSPLHSSCMRSEDTSRNAADFYVNFAGAKILVAEDSQGQILGRAIVWENVNIPSIIDSTRLIDRMYFNYEFVRQGMKKYAEEVLKVGIRKYSNSCGSQNDFWSYIPNYSGRMCWNIDVQVPNVKWHKKGAPYMDTLCYLNLNEGVLTLSNSSYKCVATFVNTDGFGRKERRVCPVCGTLSHEDGLCIACKDKFTEVTPLGVFFKGGTKTYKGKKYPMALFVDGKPSKNFMNWIGIQRLTDYNFKL